MLKFFQYVLLPPCLSFRMGEGDNSAKVLHFFEICGMNVVFSLGKGCGECRMVGLRVLDFSSGSSGLFNIFSLIHLPANYCLLFINANQVLYFHLVFFNTIKITRSLGCNFSMC